MKSERPLDRWMKQTLKGHLKLATLTLLHRGALHGYQIRKRLREETNGEISPGLGTIYPILRELERLGYVRSVWQRRRRVYQLTKNGQLSLERAKNRIIRFIDNIQAFYKK